MINLFERLLNLIYVRSCYFCNSTKDDSYLCQKCYSKIQFMPIGVFRQILGCDVYSVTIYDGIIKTLIQKLKYKNKKKLAFHQAQIMYEYWQSLNLNDNYVILPVPIHKERKKERKYNHMDLVADEFAKLSKYNTNKNFIVRIKDTKKQYNLHKAERIENIKNAFALDENFSFNKNANILIIDDITATGTTLEEIIKLLQTNGYNNITCLTLATPDIWNKK